MSRHSVFCLISLCGLHQGLHADSVSPFPPAGAPRTTLTFIENRGQWDSPARFLVRGGDLLARLDRDGIALTFRERVNPLGSQAGAGVESRFVRMTFQNSSTKTTVVGKDERACRYNFFIGADASRWRSNVPAYAGVLYRELYDGIDLELRDSGAALGSKLPGRLEYDVLLRPGADLAQVVIRCEGIERISIGDHGELVMHTPLSAVRQARPTTWQVHPSGTREIVECRYRLLDRTAFGFETTHRDPDLALVIDPVIEWGTFIGGGGDDYGWDVEVAGDGGLIVAGKTLSPEVIIAEGDCDPFDDEHGGGKDAFICRLDGAGVPLQWTFLGGTADEEAITLALGEDGSINVAGYTTSENFPVTNDSSNGGDLDGFVARLDATACELVFATYFGGSDEDVANSIAVDAADAIVIAGYTGSRGLPTTANAFQPEYGGGRYDAFVSRFHAGAGGTLPEQLDYSTYLGGTGAEAWDGATNPQNDFFVKLYTGGLVTDRNGVVTVVGSTSSFDFPITETAFDRSLDAPDDAYVTRLDLDAMPPGAQLLYSTYLGRHGLDHASAVALDPAGGLWVTGETTGGFPTTPDAVQRENRGHNDTFISHLDPDLESEMQLVYSTLLGGASFDPPGRGLVVSPTGFVILGGLVQSENFPVTEASSPFQGDTDAFLSVFDRAGTLFYSTYIGGFGFDEINNVALTPSGKVVVTGDTRSARFDVLPEVNGQGGEDAFVLIVDLFPAAFRRGDCNSDASVNIADAVCILDWLFAGEGAPGCVAATNTSGDDDANIADAVYLLSHLFAGSPAPAPPFPDCGTSELEADARLGCDIGCRR